MTLEFLLGTSVCVVRCRALCGVCLPLRAGLLCTAGSHRGEPHTGEAQTAPGTHWSSQGTPLHILPGSYYTLRHTRPRASHRCCWSGWGSGRCSEVNEALSDLQRWQHQPCLCISCRSGLPSGTNMQIILQHPVSRFNTRRTR